MYVALIVCLGDGDVLSGLDWDTVWENSAVNLVVGSNSLELLSGGVVDLTLLWLAFLQWEQDQLGLVGAESLSVELELLSAGVGSAMINGDTNSASESGGDANGLELIESESTTVANLACISAGGR